MPDPERAEAPDAATARADADDHTPDDLTDETPERETPGAASSDETADPDETPSEDAASGTTPIPAPTSRPPTPMHREAPQSSERVRVRAIGMPHESPIRYYFYRDVLEELRHAAQWNPRVFAVAALSGQMGISPDGPFIEITGFEGLEYMERLDSLIETLQGCVEREYIDAHHRGDREDIAVGFWLSAPGSGARLHREAMRAHLSLFNVPFQLALMSDGTSEQLACYARHRRGAFFNASFHVVEAITDATASGGVDETVDRDDAPAVSDSPVSSAPGTDESARDGDPAVDQSGESMTELPPEISQSPRSEDSAREDAGAFEEE